MRHSNGSSNLCPPCNDLRKAWVSIRFHLPNQCTRRNSEDFTPPNYH